MALEVRIFREVTDIDAKVVWVLTWRQFVVAMVGVVILLAVGAALLLTGGLQLVKWLPYVLTPVMTPLVLWAWVKPMGMRFEKWLPHAWRAVREPRTLRYSNDPMSFRQMKWFDDAHVGRTNVSRKKANRCPEAGR